MELGNSAMKKTSFALSLLLLFAGGCGYTSSAECNLREAQKCSTDACLIRALAYCEDHQGKQYSKAFREADKRMKEEKDS